MGNRLHSIRYITSHFHDLQGLRILPLGVLLLAAATGSAAWTPWSDFMREDWETSTYALLIALLLLYGLIARYYRHRFGRVVPRSKSNTNICISILFWSAFFVAIILDSALMPSFSLTYLVIGLGVLYSGLDGSRRYGHLLLGAIMISFAFWPLLPGSTSTYFTIFLTIVGIGFVFIGISDHFILVRTLRTIQDQ